MADLATAVAATMLVLLAQLGAFDREPRPYTDDRQRQHPAPISLEQTVTTFRGAGRRAPVVLQATRTWPAQSDHERIVHGKGDRTAPACPESLQIRRGGSLRTSHALRDIVSCGAWLAEAGDRGPYFLALRLPRSQRFNRVTISRGAAVPVAPAP
jgi:hypothetical protein